jgi:hypothetical protein
VAQLDLEAQDLRNSLAQANQETQVLRTMLHDQKDYQEELKGQLQKV